MRSTTFVRVLFYSLVACLPVIVAGGLAAQIKSPPTSSSFPTFLLPPPLPSGHLDTMGITSVLQLERLYSDLNFTWPPTSGTSVPRIAVAQLPRDWTAIRSSDRRKTLFLRILLPLVLAENERIRAERRLVLEAIAQGTISIPGSAHRLRVEELARYYRVRADLHTPAGQHTLLERLDVVPVAVALAQAAAESGWGSSRIARAANNIFGHMTEDPSKGIALAPVDGTVQHARRFDSLRDAVRAYVDNINTGKVYRPLRRLRAIHRHQNPHLDAVALAGELNGYSSRGADYVADVRILMRQNRLDHLRRVELSSETAPRALGARYLPNTPLAQSDDKTPKPLAAS